MALAACGSQGDDPPTDRPPAAATGSATDRADSPPADAAGVDARLEELDAALTSWAGAATLDDARAAAEAARNLVTGPDVEGYGDADGDDSVSGANRRGLLPGETGVPGLVTRPATACVERDVLGGSWADPVARWDEVRRRIADWTPTNNTFPDLPSHPQRVVGWASLTLKSTSLAAAREYAGHARIHVDVTVAALSGC